MYPPENEHVPTISKRKWIICTQLYEFSERGITTWRVAPPGGRSGARCQSQCSLGGRRKVKLAGFAPENRSKRPKKKKNIFSNAWIFRGRLLLVSGWRYPSFWKYAVFFRWNWRKNPLFGQKPQVPRNGNVIGYCDRPWFKQATWITFKQTYPAKYVYTLNLHDRCFDWKCTFLERMKETWK